MTKFTMVNMIPDDIKVKPGKEGDLRCGVGSCQPKALQKCANMKLFAVILAFQMLYHLSLMTYYRGVIRTVERRFGFSTQDTGVIGSVGDAIQTIFVLFIGYFARKTHKPRFLSISFLFSGIGAFLLALPYFIYGPLKYSDVSLTTSLQNHTIDGLSAHSPGAAMMNYQVCEAGAGVLNDSSMCGNMEGAPARESNVMAYAIFLLAFIILNLSGSGIFTLAIAFIDENVKKDDSGVYIGFVQSMFSIGPIFGFSLAAVTTRLPEDLMDSTLSPTDPQFIGCWWLGSVIVGCLMIATSIPLFFFPKHFPDYYRYHKSTNKTETSTSSKGKNPILHELKQFLKSLWRLASSPTVVLLLLSKVCTIYFIIGVLINMPRYIEIHFHKPAFIANIGSAVSGALTGAIGNLLGGIIMKKGKIQPRGAARIYLMALLVTVAGLCVMMLMSCPQSAIYGQRSTSHSSIEVSNECNADCGCDRDRIQPVCSPDGEMYFSPCHAGCRSGINGTYSDCTCTAENVTSLSDDFCGASCSYFIPYLATFMIIILLGNIARVPATILLFRVVDAELKAFSLGILSSLINLLGFVPGPIMFGALFDSTCLLWQSKCGSRGACLIYDIASFRYYMHGVTVSFQTLAFIFAAFMYYFLIKHFTGKKEPDKDTCDLEKEAMLAIKKETADTTEQK